MIVPRIVPYSPEHREGIHALMGASESKRRMWDWQFSPLEAMTPSPALVLEADEKIIGFNAVMPVTVSLNGTRINALWSCDFYVAAEFRGKGFGTAMKSRLKQQARLIMAFNISNLAAPVLKQSGWRAINGIYVARRIVNAKGRQKLLVILQLFNQLRRFPSRHGSAAFIADLDSQLPAPAELDLLWQRVADGYFGAVVRDSAYLYWRYTACPFKAYRFVVVRDIDGMLCGLIVVRESKGTLRIVDLVAAAGDAVVRRALIGKVLMCFPHCNRYVCGTSDLTLLHELEACGFYVSRDRPRFYVWGNEQLGELPYRPWFIMDGDCDGEMLAAAKDFWEDTL